MRILVISSYFHPHKGGSQTYIEELYSNLVKTYKDIAVDVIAYNTDKAKSFEKYRGLNIYRIRAIQVLPGQFALPNYIELYKTINKLSKKYKYEYINSNNRFFDHTFWTPFVAKKLNIRSILTDHCASHPTHNSVFIRLFSLLVDRLFVPFIAKYYSLVITTNKETQRFLNSLGVKNSKVVYGGVDTHFFNPQKRQILRTIPKSKIRVNKKDIIITFLGRLIESKGPEIFIESAKKINNKYKNTVFVCAGDGPLFKNLSKNQSDRIIFTGNIDRNEVSQLLANSDIFVSPSLHHEGFPNVILEAGASGSSVITTNQGGTSEIINDKTGVFITPNPNILTSALLSLIKNKSRRQNLSAGLRSKIVKHYNWTNIVRDYRKLI